MATALTPSGRGLAVAVFLSAAAHAGTLLIAGSPTEPVGGAGGGAGMSVQLAAAGGAPETGSASEGDEGEAAPPSSPEDDPASPSARAADQGAPSTPARPEMAEPSVKEPPSEAASATSREEEAAQPVNEKASTDPAPEADRDASGASGASGGSGEPEVDRGHLRARARDALKGHFHYPPVAIRRGWEGEVRLAFRVTAEGEIRDIHVTRGSGHGMLDNAAREALQRVARLKAPGHAVELELPVHFRLREG